MEKNRRKILRKNVFYIHTIIVTKQWWKKRAKQFFQKHTNSARKKWEKIITKKCEIVRAKNDWKKTPQKIPKNRFLYSQEYRDQKWGGKKRAKHFFQKH